MRHKDLTLRLGFTSIYPFMLKSYQRILIEAWINIYNLVTLDFSPGTTGSPPKPSIILSEACIRLF
jgi:hypothetical protein